MNWPLIGVVVSIAGLPLTLIAMYLRSIREQYHAMNDAIERVEREYTTKREWERELAQMRYRLDRLGETMTDVATRIRTDHGLLAQLERDRRRMMVLSEHAPDPTRKAIRP